MDRDDLLNILADIHRKQEDSAVSYSAQDAHFQADLLLIAYICDEEITEAFHKIKKWYA